MSGVYWDGKISIFQIQFDHEVLWKDNVPQGLNSLTLEVDMMNKLV